MIHNKESIKEYTALITQSGTNNPTILNIYNTTDLTVTWTRLSSGIYNGLLSSAIDINKSALNTGPMQQATWWLGCYLLDSQNIYLQTRIGSTNTDGMLTNFLIQLYIYNQFK